MEERKIEGVIPGDRYKLISDGDGHYYLVPIYQLEAFEAWVGDTESYWNGPDTDEPEPKMPLGVVSLGCSPTCVSFADPRLD